MPSTSSPIRPFDRLARCSQFVRLLRDDLKELLLEPADAGNARWVVAVVDKLLDEFEEERDLKQTDDYFDCILERFPTWQPKVTQLCDVQSELVTSLRLLQRQLARADRSQGVSDEHRNSLHAWIAASETHEHQETALAQVACTLDVGTGD